MKVVQINTVCGSGSTGKICVAISELLTEKGVENYIMYASGNSSYSLSRRYMVPWEIKLQALKSRILGNFGFNSQRATRRLIKMLEEIQPDIVHMHNMHGHNCDLEILFNYYKSKNIKVIWTFHDCWAFTGYCPHYTMVKCNQWKTKCGNCPQRKKYSWFFDRSRDLFEKKKDLFTNLNLTIVTPSQWLADQIQQSFLYKANVKVIRNGIDLTIFRPCESNFREYYHCQNKFIVLGVAFDWGIRKGLDVFIKLAERLDSRFQIVLVGTNDETDKKLPSNIISIHRTADQKELAEIYSAADIFVNPTREDNLPTTHIEALACGTPVLTVAVGGCGEMLDETCGKVISMDSVEGMDKEIHRICESKPFTKKSCVEKAGTFDAAGKFEEYILLYEEENKISH